MKLLETLFPTIFLHPQLVHTNLLLYIEVFHFSKIPTCSFSFSIYFISLCLNFSLCHSVGSFCTFNFLLHNTQCGVFMWRLNSWSWWKENFNIFTIKFIKKAFPAEWAYERISLVNKKKFSSALDKPLCWGEMNL